MLAVVACVRQLERGLVLDLGDESYLRDALSRSCSSCVLEYHGIRTNVLDCRKDVEIIHAIKICISGESYRGSWAEVM